MEKMLITQALNELKTLDRRIDRETNQAKFIAAAKISEKNVTPQVSKEDFMTEAKASLAAVTALIARRKAIKNAIVKSNAMTEVEVAGEKMTVAEAIELKSSIEYQKCLLRKMNSDYSSAANDMIRNNAVMEGKIDTLVTTAVGKDDKSKKSDEAIAIADSFRARNEYGLVDPLDLKKKISDMTAYIEDFEANVDSVLQISNCQTFIEV